MYSRFTTYCNQARQWFFQETQMEVRCAVPLPIYKGCICFHGQDLSCISSSYPTFTETSSPQMLAAYSLTVLVVQQNDGRIADYGSGNINLYRRALGLDPGASSLQNIDGSPGYRRYAGPLLPDSNFQSRVFSYLLVLRVASIGLLRVYCRFTKTISL
jgi:hypothetical protein